jgi:flagellar basal body rod protein FlgC
MTAQENPFAGTWIANLSKSKRHPDNQFREATLEFAVNGESLTITDVVVNASGKEEKGRHKIQIDGKEHPSADGNGYFITANWLASHVLETTAKKAGEIVGRGMYLVSQDGKTLTISADQQLIVCDRK